jgi:hypothetical protein
MIAPPFPFVNSYNTMRLKERHDYVQGEMLIEPTITNLAVTAIIIMLAVWIARRVVRVIFKSELKELHERHRNR